ncbi:MAG TPA: DNA polymerase III subunit alpha, partial [Planctomycetaceae bacterium]|nr:DNA polymerase III subunit alpha [Planctomycetaceae bacterium]
YEAYIAPGSRFERKGRSSKEASYHLTLLARDRQGFRNLLKLASAAYLEGFYYKPRIDRELLAAHHEGLICLSGCVSSEFSQAILRGGADEHDLAEAEEIAEWFHRLFGDRYFVEIMNNDEPIQRSALQGAVDLAQRKGLPLVATSDCHYVLQDDKDVQDVLLCVNTGRFRADANRMRMIGDYSLRGPEEMYDAFPGLEEAVARSQEIADTVSIELDLGKRHFPVYTLPEDKTAEQLLRELCEKGLRERYEGDDTMCSEGELAPHVQQRLDRELSVINKLGFANYFLIVWDFVRQAREQNIPATARGSGVGAIVCYALYLSHVCPIKYGLLFERFLDENRREAPDIDIDFCKEWRSEIIKYVKEKYGEENVAQIGTFGTLQARQAIKDVGRVLGIPLSRVNEITAMVPAELKITIEKALAKNDDLRQAYEQDGAVRELLDLARRLEGLARNVGTHAAGVVIGDKPLTEYVPLCRVSNKEDIITQWAMKDVEDAGLLKMDFLGLRNLTILRKAVVIVEQTTGKRLDLHRIPLDDRETFGLLCRGETKGVFQLESGGIRDLLQRMKPDHFRDIIAT